MPRKRLPRQIVRLSSCAVAVTAKSGSEFQLLRVLSLNEFLRTGIDSPIQRFVCCRVAKQSFKVGDLNHVLPCVGGVAADPAAHGRCVFVIANVKLRGAKPACRRSVPWSAVLGYDPAMTNAVSPAPTLY